MSGRSVERPLALLGSLSLIFLAASRLWSQSAERAGWSDVVFSEIHYHPPEDRGSGEFLELHNAGVYWLDLADWRLDGGVRFTFPRRTVLAPGGYVVVANDAEALRGTLGEDTVVVGDFKGRLGNQDDILELRAPDGHLAAWMHYRDGFDREHAIWPRAPDGFGPSLELIHPHPDWSRPWFWAASLVPGGTPGRANSVATPFGPGGSGPAASAVTSQAHGLRLNEARLVSGEPFVEIRNVGEQTEKLDGLRLALDTASVRVELTGSVSRSKFEVVEGEELEPLVIEEGARPRASLLYLLDEEDHLLDVLPIALTSERGSCVRPSVLINAAQVVDDATPGEENAIEDSPVVINEIHYHTAGDDKTDEFIEFHNTTSKEVSIGGWRLRRAVELDFPEDATIPPRGFVLATRDPDSLERRVGGAGAVPIFGPWKGALSNRGETILLLDARGSVADVVPYRDKESWPAGADGDGFSAELLQPELDNAWGEAWTEGPPGGSPGRANARAVKATPPMIVGLYHEPILPTAREAVVIHAHVTGTRRLSQVGVVYREVLSGSRPQKRTLTDRGKAGDGAAGDGHYAVALPRFPAGALIGFSIYSRDRSGRTTQIPAAGNEFYIQVRPRQEAASSWPAPVYHVLMPPERWQEMHGGRRREKTWYPCSFVAEVIGRRLPSFLPAEFGSVGTAAYQAAIRFRGNNSIAPERNPLDPPDSRMSYRIRLERGVRFEGRDRLILNAYSYYRQKAAWDVFHAVGLPSCGATLVHLRSPGLDDRRYVDVQVVDDDFLEDRFGDSSGSLFRGRRGSPFGADFAYHGPEVEPYLRVYRRENKKGSTDISSLLELLQALSIDDDDEYAARVAELADVDEWTLYFAANNVLGNIEGGLSFDAPDDFFLGQYSEDGKFAILPWDNDSTFVEVEQKLFRPRLPAIRRFLSHPRFAPLYHAGARDVLDGPLSPTGLRRWLRYYDSVLTPRERDNLEQFARLRRRYLLDEYYARRPSLVAQLGGTESVRFAGAGGVVFVAEASAVSLQGWLEAGREFRVRVGSRSANLDRARGSWGMRLDGTGLAPGSNPLWVEFLGRTDASPVLRSLNLHRVPALRIVTRAPVSDTTWSASEGPYVVTESIEIPQGVTLTLAAGAQVLCADGVSIRVRGTLAANGTAASPVVFRPAGGNGDWQGIEFAATGNGASSKVHVLRHVRFEGGTAVSAAGGGAVASAAGLDGFLRVDRSRVRLERCFLRDLSGVAIGARSARLELVGTTVHGAREGLVARRGRVSVRSSWLRHVRGAGLRLEGLEEECRIESSRVSWSEEGAIVLRGGQLVLVDALLDGCGIGLDVAAGARLEGEHTTIASAGVAFALDVAREGEENGVPGAARGPTSRLRLSDSVIGPCIDLFDGPPGARLELERCLVPDHFAIEGRSLIRGAPRFLDPALGDFHLADGSPGRDASESGADLGIRPSAER